MPKWGLGREMHDPLITYKRLNKWQAEKIERLESYCRDYAEMTGITLNVPDETREAFNKAVSGRRPP